MNPPAITPPAISPSDALPRPKWFVPAVIGCGVVAVFAAGAYLYRSAAARTNDVALDAEPKIVTVVEATSSSFRASRRYIATVDPWLEARIGPQLVSKGYVDTVAAFRPGAVVKKGRSRRDARLQDGVGASCQSVAMDPGARSRRKQEAISKEADRRQNSSREGIRITERRRRKKLAEERPSPTGRHPRDEGEALLGTSLEVDDCILRAPFDGEVATRSADPGAFVRPGGAIISTIVQRDTVRVSSDVPEVENALVAPDTKLHVHFLAIDRTVDAPVARRSPNADATLRTIHVEADIPDPERTLPVGTTAEVTVDVGAPVPAAALPLSAVSIRGDHANLFVIEGGIAKKMSVKVLGEATDRVYVDPSIAGKKVVSEGRALLADGDHVKASEAEADARPHIEGGAVTGLSLRNPIAIIMLAIALIVFASVETPNLPIDTFPELTPPVLVVGTQAPGLGPKDVEKTLTWRIEKSVSATPGIEHVQSVSRNGLSIVYVWLKWGTDLNAAQTLVQQQVAFAMSSVPKSLGVLPPFVLQYDPTNAPVVQIAVSGEGMTAPQLYDFAQNNIEPIIEGIPGVASAAVDGGRVRQINVVVDPEKAAARGLTSVEVAQAVSQSNALLPSGEFISKNFDANVYTDAVPQKVREIGDAAVRSKNGTDVLIRDVARVEDGGAPETQAVTVDGEDGVALNVLRVPGGNTLAIVDGVKKAVEDLKPKLPPGVKITPIFDQSTFVRTTYSGLKKEIVQALVLISIVILVFLQSPRAVLVALIAIPVSFAIILLVLAGKDQTLNAFTLGGLTLAMGPLVDISVVVIESIHRQRSMGMPIGKAALEGTKLVALPTFAATLTTTAVLIPVVLLAGLAKKLFVPLALTVGAGMFAGYLVSMTLTPIAAKYILGESHHGRFATAVEGVIHGIAERYSRALRAVLPYRPFVVGACLLLVTGAVWVSSHLPSTFFPDIDESMDQVYVRVAPGTPLSESSRMMREMGATVKKELGKENVELVLTNLGSPSVARSAMTSPNAGPHMGFLRFQFTDPEKRKLNQRELSDKIRKILNDHYPGVEFLQAPGGLVANVFTNGYLGPLVIEVKRRLTRRARRRGARHQRGRAHGPRYRRDLYPSIEVDYPEIRVETDRQLASQVGVTSRMAAQSTLDATMGNINTPGVWIDASNGQSYYVVTSYDHADVGDVSALADLPVRVRDGSPGGVKLSSYGHIRRSVGPIVVERNALQRVAHLLMQTEGRDIGSAAAELERKLREGRSANPQRGRGLRRPSGSHANDLRRFGRRHLPRNHGRVHDHGIAVQIASPSIRHALHDPGVARRHRGGAHGRGSGALDHRFHGCLDGRGHRGLERHPPRRRREPPPSPKAAPSPLLPRSMPPEHASFRSP